MSSHRIPFNKPAIVGDELRYIREAVESGHLSGDGAFTKRCSALPRPMTSKRLWSSRKDRSAPCTFRRTTRDPS